MTGSFTRQGVIAFVESHDIDNDGRDEVLITSGTFPPDLPATARQGTFVDFSGSALATMTGAMPVTMHPRDYVIANFNGDAYLDIFIADHGYDTNPFPGHPNTLLLGSAAGFVNASANIPALQDFTHSAAAGDIDKDGDIDLYVGNLYGQQTTEPYLLLNDGAANFTLDRTRLPDSVATGVANTKVYSASEMADLNKDGWVDLIVGSDGSAGGSHVFLNDKTGHFTDTSKTTLPLHPNAGGTDAIYLDFQSMDINGDGANDLITLSTDNVPFYSGWWLQILINDGAGNFIDETTERLGAASFNQNGGWIRGIRIADFNGDGTQDLIAQSQNNGGSNDTIVWLNDSAGYFAPLSKSDIVGPGNLWFFGANTSEYVDSSGQGFYQIYDPTPTTTALAKFATVTPAQMLLRPMTGTAGNDTIVGDAGRDYLQGLGGKDSLDGAGGNDTMIGGTGDDSYVVDSTGDVVTELVSEGSDTVYTSVSINVPNHVEVLIMSGSGDLSAGGTSTRDIIIGNGGNNTIDGAGGFDVLQGGAGNDTYAVDNINDAVVELAGGGEDAVYSSVDIALFGEVETLILTGNAVSGFGDDTNNQIFGNAGVNVLFGRGGTDYMLGLGGDDIFVITPDNGAVDVIGDFSNGPPGSGDRIGISGFGAGAQVYQVSQESFEIRSADLSVTQQFILTGYTGIGDFTLNDDYYFS